MWADLRGSKACLAHSKILLFIPSPLYFLKGEIRKSIKVWKAHCNPSPSLPWSAAAALSARCAAGASTPPHIPEDSSTFPGWLHGFRTSFHYSPKFPHGCQGRFLGLSWLILLFLPGTSHRSSVLGFKILSLWNAPQKTPNVLFPSQNSAAFCGVLFGAFLRGENWKFHLHLEFL